MVTSAKYRKLTKRFLVIVVTIFVFASLFYVFCRKAENWNGRDEDLSFPDCLYFSSVTMSTVGYGDFAPKSASARWLTITLLMVLLLEILELVISR